MDTNDKNKGKIWWREPRTNLAMYYVYVLRSLKDRRFYTGFTDNIERRLKKHNQGFITSTKGRRPLKLIYYEACLTKRDALRREVYLKTAWGKRYIKVGWKVF